MAYEVKNQTKTNVKISDLIASKGAKELAGSLQLTPVQIQKANSAALTLSTNSMLRNCAPASILKYVYEVARYNFSRDDCVYPVPYGNSIQAQIGYKGFRELALKSGAYLDVNAQVVKECDTIKRDATTGKVKVIFEEDFDKAENSKIRGYYAFAQDKETGDIINSVYWSKKKCEEHGKMFSKTYNSLWGKNEYSFNKMALKTVLKQLCNELKTTPELESAKKLDGYVYGQGYSDNPQNKKLETSTFDNAFDNVFEEQQIENTEVIDAEVNEDDLDPFTNEDDAKVLQKLIDEKKQNK